MENNHELIEAIFMREYKFEDWKKNNEALINFFNHN